MLAGGVRLLDVVHGEVIKVLTGAATGTYTAIRETASDLVLMTELGQDPRAKRMLRFRDDGNVPALGSQDQIMTEDGKKWTAVRAPQDGYLTTDFELIELVKGKDQGR